MKQKIFFGFERCGKRGRIYILGSDTNGGVHFANFYTMADEPPESFAAEYSGKKVFNRDNLALEMKITVAPGYFNDLDEMKIWIEKQLEILGK